MDNVPEETHIVSVMTRRLGTNARIRDERDNGPLPHQTRRQGQTEKNQGNRGAGSSDTRSRIPFSSHKMQQPVMQLLASPRVSKLQV